MARPKKKGLDYFSMDVDIFEDDKLFDVQNKYGPLGEIIYIRLLCLVYKNGYYYRFESLDKLAAMLIKSIGNKWARDKKTVIDVISFLAKCNLFSSELMQENILTSRSIQMRYLAATERRQSNIEEYNLLEFEKNKQGLINAPKNEIIAYKNTVNVCNNSKNVDDNATKKSKVKKSKVNESKEESPSASAAETASFDYDSVVDLFNSICKSLIKVRSLNKTQKRNVLKADEVINGDFEGLFRRIENSDFLTGKTGSWNGATFDWILKPSNLIKIIEGNYDNKGGNNDGTNSRNSKADDDFLKSLGDHI